jgi:hypothetical protein
LECHDKMYVIKYDNANALIKRSLSVITNLVGTDKADAKLVAVLKMIKSENTNRNNNIGPILIILFFVFKDFTS